MTDADREESKSQDFRHTPDDPIDLMEVPPHHRDTVRDLIDAAGDSGGLISQTGRSHGTGAEAEQTATVEMHFHIGDVHTTEININVESEDGAAEVEGLVSDIFGGGSDE